MKTDEICTCGTFSCALLLLVKTIYCYLCTLEFFFFFFKNCSLIGSLGNQHRLVILWHLCEPFLFKSVGKFLKDAFHFFRTVSLK